MVDLKMPDNSGYNASVEGFRDDEYPMLDGEWDLE